MSTEPTTKSIAKTRGADLVALIGLLVLGAAIGAWPHFVRWVTSGKVAFIADSDGLLYHAWARDALLTESLSLTDAVHQPTGPVMHPPVLFVPAAKQARALGCDLGLVWRLLAGIGIAGGLCYALRPLMPSLRSTALLSACLVCDGGLLFGQLGLHQLQALGSLMIGNTHAFDGPPRLFAHLRVPTPALPVACLLVHLGAMIRLRLTDSWRARLWAALTFSAMFHIYFFFWTAAGLALVLAFLLDREARRAVLSVAVVGGLLGLPALIAGARIKAGCPPDWLLRTDKFAPCGRFDELLFPKVAILLWLVLAWFVLAKRRERLYPWCLMTAGLIWLNEQVLTQLQFENFHWTHAYGVAASVLVAMLAGPWLAGRACSRRFLLPVLGVAIVAWIAGAFWMRTVEALNQAETAWVDSIAAAWEREAPKFPPGSVVAGDPDALAYAAATSLVRPLSARVAEYSALINDRELDTRLCLNWYLSGCSRDEALTRVNAPAGTWGREAHAVRHPDVAAQQALTRIEIIQTIWSNPQAAMQPFEIRFLVLRQPSRPPAELLPDLIPIPVHGSTWIFWERKARVPAAGPR